MKLLGLNILRAAAILSVLVCHVFAALLASQRTLISDYPLISQFIMSTGFLGVEIFFVLSGFLIGQIVVKLYNSGMTWDKIRLFYARRWLRTLPLYYLLLGLKFLLSPQGFPLSALVFLHPLNPTDLEYYGITWSLAIEEWFYLLLPLICWGVSKLFGNRRLGYVLVATVVILIALRTWLVSVHHYWDFEKQVRTALPLRFDAILTGVLIAFVRQNYRWWFDRLARPWVAASGLVIAAVLYGAWSINLQSWNVMTKTMTMPILSLSIAVVLPWMAESAFINRKLVRVKWFSWPVTQISLISYALYLTHVTLMPQIKVWVGNPYLTAANIMVVMVIAFIMAAGFYYWFELPLLKLRDKLHVPDNTQLVTTA